MSLSRTLKTRLVGLSIVAISVGVWLAYDWHCHRVIVLLPDGSLAQNPSVRLDYDPIYVYQPTIISGTNGTVHIPRRQAYGRGWETMKISASKGGKNYYASRNPSDCHYPMEVTLQELPPRPPSPPPSALEQASDLLKIINAVR